MATGRLWTYAAHCCNAPVQVWNLETDTLETTFAPRPGNGRGIAFDPIDGNIWTTTLNLTNFNGDGFIHKNRALGGPDILTIPDPGGVNGPGIGALDFDPDENVLWAATFQPINNQSVFYKIRPTDGMVLHTCSTPFRGGGLGNDTLAVARPGDLNGRKVLLTDAGEHLANLLAIDAETCVVLKTYKLRIGVTGVDVDEETGNLIAVEGNNGGTSKVHNLGPAPYRRSLAFLTVDGAVEDFSLPTKLRSAALDAGHGRHCPNQTWAGAQGPTFGDREDALALNIATALQTSLTNRQRRAILTRETECIVELQERTRIANEEKVDLFLSIHMNAGLPTANGTEVWYWVNHPKATQAQAAAQQLVNEQAALGLSNRGVKRAGIDAPWNRRVPFVLRQTRMASVISEVAFISNSQLAAGQVITDEERLHNPMFLLQVVQAMSDAIDNFFRQ